VPQYAPDVTDSDVERIIVRDYPPEHHAAIRDLIRAVEVREKPRIMLACLKNGKGDFQKLSYQLADASGYWREIVSEAEYPSYTKKMFRKLSEEDLEKLYEADKVQYLAWLSRMP
jgi:hypothetical protein